MDSFKIVSHSAAVLVKGDRLKIRRDSGLLISDIREKVVPLSNVTGVEVRKPAILTNGYIQFQISGQQSANVAYGSGLKQALEDENSITFSSSEDYKTAIAIQAYIADYNKKAKTESTADELSKYKSLLDAGAISEAEFDEIKSKLLKSV